MTTLTIEIPDEVEKTLADLIEQLGGKVISVNTNSKETRNVGRIKKLSRREKEFIKEFEEAIEFINLHQKGKIKAKTIDQLSN